MTVGGELALTAHVSPGEMELGQVGMNFNLVQK